MEFEIPRAEFVFEARVECGSPQVIGQTPEGQSMMIPILGGAVEGPHLKGRVLPGGADWPVKRADNVNIVDAQYAIAAEDGTVIRIRNRGLAVMESDGDSGRVPRYIRTVPQFIAPEGSHSWLNKAIFVGTLDVNPKQGSYVTVRVFKVV